MSPFPGAATAAIASCVLSSQTTSGRPPIGRADSLPRCFFTLLYVCPDRMDLSVRVRTLVRPTNRTVHPSADDVFTGDSDILHYRLATRLGTQVRLDPGTGKISPIGSAAAMLAAGPLRRQTVFSKHADGAS